MTEDLEVHIIEIPKIARNLEEGKLKKWILFLEKPEGEETKKMAEREKEIKEAIDTLEKISEDESKIRIAELRQKYIMDREEELETAEAIGREQGIQKEKRELARKMKQKNIPIETITQITGLSLKEIEELS